MKKIALVTIILLALSTPVQALFHLTFIVVKETFNIDGTDYDVWVIDSGGEEYYFMSYGDAAPEGYTIYRINRLMASSGGYDIIYYVTSIEADALIASVSVQYAGGSAEHDENAWVDFTARSYEQTNAHSAFPAGTAARLVLPCRWQVEGVWTVWNTVGDWVTAGSPDPSEIKIGVKISGQ